MDATLHCNDLKCRALLNDSAVVTTCSHVFCLPCADRLELSAPPDGQRKCPACGTYLMNLDDAVVAALNPTEDYKTSILSGLNPTVIMECAGRGLSFWAYQMVQEITYQDYLARKLNVRYQELSAHLDTVVRDANDENTRLHGKLDVVQAEHAALLERHKNLENLQRQKERASKQQQNLYEKLKRQHMAAGMELAAEHSVEGLLQQGSGQAGQPRDSQHQAGAVHRSRSNISGNSDERQRMTLAPNNSYGAHEYMPQGSRTGLMSSQSAPNASQNSNRQRLPQPTFGAYNSSLNVESRPRVDAPRKETPLAGGNSYTRQNISPNNVAPGLSANIRSSKPQPQGYVPASRGGIGAVGGARMAGYNPMPMR